MPCPRVAGFMVQGVEHPGVSAYSWQFLSLPVFLGESGRCRPSDRHPHPSIGHAHQHLTFDLLTNPFGKLPAVSNNKLNKNTQNRVVGFFLCAHNSPFWMCRPSLKSASPHELS